MNGGRSRGLVAITLVAAWLGWGFDVFDGLLFSYVAKPTLHSLLGQTSPEQVNAHLALLNSLFLVGWALGGILFGRVTDRIGRTRTLLATMLLYAVATAACSLSQGITSFVVFRVFASLGIGGEWAAGAALVAEVVEDRYRPLAGALLFTASPAGMWVAGKVCRHVVEGRYAQDLEHGWRYAFLLGIVPAAFAFAIRYFVEEPARWQEHQREPARLRELFAPALGRRTLTGLGVASVALVGWWGILSFIPKITDEWCERAGLAATKAATKDWGNDLFIVGSILGTLTTVPLAMKVGRRRTFALYFAGAALAVGLAFGSDLVGLGLSLEAKLRALSLVGFTVFGVFGLFPFYLPELFPTRLRGTGSGFCYNTGRLLTAVGVFGVGELQTRLGLERSLLSVGVVYVIGLALLPFAIETKGERFE
jgi:predicted MFS family arabinose efflux permease